MLKKFESAVFEFSKKYYLWIARASVFIVYFWFGALKVFGASPANPLVNSLLERTMPFISFQHFIFFFALFEILIGLLFLVPGWERLVAIFLAAHMVTTFLPLWLLPDVTWNGFLIPTLEGQYIIKNVLIIAMTFVLLSTLETKNSK